MSAVTKKFPAEYLIDDLDLPGACAGGEIISDSIVGKSRWSIDHELIFRLDGMQPKTAWCVCYREGATEMQDESPWELEYEYDEEVEASLVMLRPVTEERWVDFEPDAAKPPGWGLTRQLANAKLALFTIREELDACA
jgi:hypothetical protein